MQLLLLCCENNLASMLPLSLCPAIPFFSTSHFVSFVLRSHTQRLGVGLCIFGNERHCRVWEADSDAESSHMRSVRCCEIQRFGMPRKPS